MVYHLLLVLFFSLVTSQTTAREKAGLQALWNVTGGPGWGNLKWNIGTDPCINNWAGVQCRPFGSNQYNVWSLVLQNNNLVGSIPSEIGLLDQLQFLYLSKNRLQGSLPSQIGELRQLIQLGLDGNMLTGGIPQSVSLIGGLQWVYLQDNQLTGPIDVLGGLPNLQYLYLSRNRIIGSLPPLLGNIFTLQQVGVDTNMFTGVVPSGFGFRQNLLQSFYGQGNQFTGPFPVNLCNPTITNCDLSGSAFNCPLPNPTCCHAIICTPVPPPPPFSDIIN